MKTEIKLDNISFEYTKNDLLFSKINLTFSSLDNTKKHIAILGNSGCGKSTLLKIILGLLTVQKGKVSYNKKDIITAYVPQEAILFEHLTPLKNAEYFKYNTHYKKYFNQQLFERLSKALDMHKIFKTNQKVIDLSGGEKQRLSLLRALSIKPDVLFLDEPSVGLDANVKATFISKLHELSNELNLLTFYVTHHLDEVKLFADEVAFITSNKKENSISIQSVSDFIETPPNIQASKIIDFPYSTIFTIKQTLKELTLAKEENCEFYALIRKENIIVLRPKEKGLKFQFLYGSNTIAYYKHIETNNLLLLENRSNNQEIINVKLKGNILLYLHNGNFSHLKEL